MLYFTHGLNFGIDFVGGTLLEVQIEVGGRRSRARCARRSGGLGLGEVQLQQFGTPRDVLIRVSQQPGGEQAQQAAIAKIKEALGDEVEYRQEAVVGPRISTELLAYSAIGLMTAIFGILIYLWFRFEWQFALGAMVANVHDLVLTIGFMSLFQIDFDLASIAALLTILGYSLNDTVVIYDRIRELLRRYKRMPIPELLNISINSTMTRSVNTHVTVTLALLAMYFFGGHAIHSFTATMLFGVVLVGTYTSVFIAAPLLIYFGVGSFRGSTDRGRAGARSRRRRASGPERGGRAAPSSISGADRGLRQGRLPLRRHVASRLAVVPAGRHLAVAGARSLRHHRGGARAGVRPRGCDRPVPDRGRARRLDPAAAAAGALQGARRSRSKRPTPAARSRPTTSCWARGAAWRQD